MQGKAGILKNQRTKVYAMRSQSIKRREANILQSLSLCYRDQDSFIIEICSIQLSQERENV